MPWQQGRSIWESLKKPSVVGENLIASRFMQNRAVGAPEFDNPCDTNRQPVSSDRKLGTKVNVDTGKFVILNLYMLRDNKN